MLLFPIAVKIGLCLLFLARVISAIQIKGIYFFFSYVKSKCDMLFGQIKSTGIFWWTSPNLKMDRLYNSKSHLGFQFSVILDQTGRTCVAKVIIWIQNPNFLCFLWSIMIAIYSDINFVRSPTYLSVKPPELIYRTFQQNMYSLLAVLVVVFCGTRICCWIPIFCFCVCCGPRNEVID